MRVAKVFLQNFLSYPSQFLELDAGLNVLVGANGAGKTNFIESIYYCSLAKSPRNLKDKEILTRGSTGGARIRLLSARAFGEHTVDVYIDEAGKKRITVDELPIARIGELLGILTVVFFSPNEMKLIKEAPSERRRFLDISLSQQDKTYFYTLQKYNKLLAQRNKVLKNYKNSDKLGEYISLVDRDLSVAAAYIIKARKAFVATLSPIADAVHKQLAGGGSMEIAYETEDAATAEDIAVLYAKALAKDTALEHTSVGPHHDDLKISADGIDIRRYGSQGQQRTAVLALKLASAEQIMTATGETPVLLLDDVLSELDADRQKALIEASAAYQTIITGTSFPEGLAENYTQFKVEDRKIERKL